MTYELVKSKHLLLINSKEGTILSENTNKYHEIHRSTKLIEAFSYLEIPY